VPVRLEKCRAERQGCCVTLPPITDWELSAAEDSSNDDSNDRDAELLGQPTMSQFSHKAMKAS